MEFESETAEILMIGKDNPNIYLGVVDRINQALQQNQDSAAPVPKLIAKVSTELGHLVEAFADDLVPALVCFDISSIKQNPEEALYLKNYIHGIKVLDPSSVIVGLCEQIPAKKELTEWMQVGLSVWLKKDFETAELESSLKETFSKKVSMVPRKLRVKVDHTVEIRMANLAQASVAEVLDLGMGGMFIRTSPAGIKPGDKIEFSVKIVQQLGGSLMGKSQSQNPIDLPDEIDEGENLGGTALVVWVRPVTNKLGPEGIGVQFLTVDSKTQQFFKKALVKRKVRIFVPEG